MLLGCELHHRFLCKATGDQEDIARQLAECQRAVEAADQSSIVLMQNLKKMRQELSKKPAGSGETLKRPGSGGVFKKPAAAEQMEDEDSDEDDEEEDDEEEDDEEDDDE